MTSTQRDIEEDEEEVKLIIKSILGSSATQMNLRDLCKLYFEMTGKRIPCNRFGYMNIEEYLKSIPDTLIVQGSGPYASATPVLSEDSAHIIQMIARQRKSKHSHCYRPKPKNRAYIVRTSHPHHPADALPPACFYRQSPQPLMQQFVPPPCFQAGYFPRHNHGLPQRNSYPNNQRPHYRSINLSPSPPRQEHSLPSDSPSTSRSMDEPPMPTKTTSADADQLRKQTRQEEEEEVVVMIENDVVVVVDDMSDQNNDQRTTASSSFSMDHNTNYKIPFVVQENLRHLIETYPDGIWLRKLPDEYRKMYNCELEFAKYNYLSLVQMCCSLREIFRYKQLRKDDGKLYDARTAIPEDTDLLNVVDELQPVREEELYVKALPDGISAEKGKDDFPAYTMLLGETIEVTKIPPIKDGDYFPVMIAEVYDVSKFYFNLASADKQLDELQDNISKFYNANYKQYAITKSQLARGLYCVIYRLGEYQRARVVKYDDAKLKVFCVDTGTVMSTTLSNIYFLHKQFTDLPRQGLRGRLPGLLPPTEGAQWGRDIAYRFLELVRDKVMYAAPANVDDTQTDLIYDLILCDCSGNEDVIIQDCLINEGFAVSLPQEQIELEVPLYDDYEAIVENLHLFPTFIELENAAVPTALEMRRLIGINVPLYEIYPIYFKNKQFRSEITQDQDEQVAKFVVRKNLATFIRDKTNAKTHEVPDEITENEVTPVTEPEQSEEVVPETIPVPKLSGPVDAPPLVPLWNDSKFPPQEVPSSIPSMPRPPPGFTQRLVVPPYPLPPNLFHPSLMPPMGPLSMPFNNFQPPPPTSQFANYREFNVHPMNGMQGNYLNFFGCQNLNLPYPNMPAANMYGGYQESAWLMQQQKLRQSPAYNAYPVVVGQMNQNQRNFVNNLMQAPHRNVNLSQEPDLIQNTKENVAANRTSPNVTEPQATVSPNTVPNTVLTEDSTPIPISNPKNNKPTKKYVITAVVNNKKIHVVRISVPCIIPAEIQQIYSGKNDLAHLRRYLIMSDITLSHLRLDSINDSFTKELIQNDLITGTQDLLEYTSLSNLEELIRCITNEECQIPGFNNLLDNFSEKSPLWNV